MSDEVRIKLSNVFALIAFLSTVGGYAILTSSRLAALESDNTDHKRVNILVIEKMIPALERIETNQQHELDETIEIKEAVNKNTEALAYFKRNELMWREKAKRLGM